MPSFVCLGQLLFRVCSAWSSCQTPWAGSRSCTPFPSPASALPSPIPYTARLLSCGVCGREKQVDHLAAAQPSSTVWKSLYPERVVGRTAPREACPVLHGYSRSASCMAITFSAVEHGLAVAHWLRPSGGGRVFVHLGPSSCGPGDSRRYGCCPRTTSAQLGPGPPMCTHWFSALRWAFPIALCSVLTTRRAVLITRRGMSGSLISMVPLPAL